VRDFYALFYRFFLHLVVIKMAPTLDVNGKGSYPDMAKKFQKVNIEISNICNLQCSFCPEVLRTKAIMAPSLFREVIRQVAPITRQVTLHLMGEPLVHPQLSELVTICHEEGVRIFFVSNGVLLREKEAALLLHPAFRQVNFSLHSFQDNFGEKDPTEYLERIFRFTENALAERPDLYLNYRLWNLGEVNGKRSSNLAVLEKIEERFGVKVPRNWDLRLGKSFPIKRRLALHFDVEFIWPGSDLPIIGETGTCRGLSNHFGVLVDGTVVPCCLDKEGKIPLGKIPEQPINEILMSPRAQAIVAGFKARKLIEPLCQRCQYIERFNEPDALPVAAPTP